MLSVGMPTYNGARYLQVAIDSILSQDLSDLELVISDNGSNDDTEMICRVAAERDTRIRYVRTATNRGAAWNYSKVLELARAPYFKWAADDDICQPSFLRRCVEALDRSSNAVVAFPLTTLIDALGNPVGVIHDEDLDLRDPDPVGRLSVLLRHRVEWHPVFGVVRADQLRRTRGIGPFPIADVALLAELALRGEFHQVPERLFLRRYHDGRSVVANPSFKAHAAWYVPDRPANRPALPNARLVRELLLRVADAPLPTSGRVRAAAAVAQHWALPHWRHIGGEVRIALRERIGDLRNRTDGPVVQGDQGSAGHDPEG